MDKRVINCKECKEYKNLGGGLECCNKKWECFDKKENNKIKPSYYHKGKVDTIAFAIENDLDFLQGNVVKYVVRYKDKNGLEDLKKAKEYLDRIIKNEEEKPKNAQLADFLRKCKDSNINEEKPKNAQLAL